jgi:hypothetical protein
MPIETITITDKSGANAGATKTIQINVSPTNGSGTGTVAFTGTNAGTDTYQASATIAGSNLTSNNAELAWQQVNGAIAIGPLAVSVYGNSGQVPGWAGFGGGLQGTLTANSCVINQVDQNTPINGFNSQPTNIGPGGGYKLIPAVFVEQTATGQYASSLPIPGSGSGSTGNPFILDMTGQLVVKTPGTYTVYMVFANVSQCAFWIGGGATLLSTNQIVNGGANPFPGTGPNTAFWNAQTPTSSVLMGANNEDPGLYGGTRGSYINFPVAGKYPIEIVYNQRNPVQFSGDNNGYFQLTYLAGQQTQYNNEGDNVAGTPTFFPVSIVSVPPVSSPGSGNLLLTPTGGVVSLQGTSYTMTVTVQNIHYATQSYIPVYEGTAGNLNVYNSPTLNTYSLPAFPGGAVNLTAAATSKVISVSGVDNNAWNGLFAVTAVGSAFNLAYNGGAFVSGTASTLLSIQQDDIAWYSPAAGSNPATFDLFTPSSGTGGVLYQINVDYMVKPVITSISPLTGLAADGGAKTFVATLAKPISPQQQGASQYGVNNSINPTFTFTGGISVTSVTPIVSSGFITGYNVNVTAPVSSTNVNSTASVSFSGTLTYLSGNTFTTGNPYPGTTPIPGTIVLTGTSFTNPVEYAFSTTPAGPSLPAGSTAITAQIYTTTNDNVVLTFQKKVGSTTTSLGAGTLTNSSTGTISGKTVYFKTFTGSVAVVDGDASFYLGFSVTDQASGLHTVPDPWFSTTLYSAPVIIITCFTGNVAIQTPYGDVELASLPEKFELVNETGTHWAQLLVHENYKGWMLEIAPGKLVTLDHEMKVGTEWLTAEEKYPTANRVWFEGTVYNAHVLSANPEDKHYILWNGDIAHNKAAVCFSPNTKVKTQRGDLAIIDVKPGDLVPTARGTWGVVEYVTSLKWDGLMLDMGDGELSTTTHHVKDNGAWKPMQDLDRFPVVHYKGTIHNLHITCDPDDDGTALDTEHSYTLANGLVVHNVTTVA